MTQDTDLLVRRIEALRALVSEIQKHLADRMDLAADWLQGHPERLQRYRRAADDLRAQATPQDPLTRLAAEAHLTHLDEDLLLLALAPALDRAFGRNLAALARSYNVGAPSLDTLLGVLTSSLDQRLDAMRRLAPDAPLIQRGLLSLSRPRASSADLLAMEVHVPERVQRQLLHDAAPTRPEAHTPAPPTRSFRDVYLPPEQRLRLQAMLYAHRPTPPATPEAALVLLTGPSGTGKTVTAQAVAHDLQRPLLRVDAHDLTLRSPDLTAAFNDLLLEARLARALLFFDDCETLFASRLQGNRHLAALLAGLDRAHDLNLIATPYEEVLDPALRRRVLLRLKLETPPPALRLPLWRDALAAANLAADVDLPFLSEKYEFNGGQITVAARLAITSAAAAQAPITPAHLEDAAQAQLQQHLSQLAVRTITHLSLKDIVLPDDLMGTIRSIVAAVRNRRRIFDDWGFGERMTTGRGLSMLFRGESGTGKTLTAEILGSELALPLYRIAIPKIVSKYIGETEQNLEKAFREAQLAGAILLFDEADAIFTKRVEVANSTDRYSNMEVNLLLQEMERFEGVVILTTNLDAAIDDAFDRRLNYKLDFPFPDPPLRRQIWQRLLPDKAPLDLQPEELDYLADSFELAGGSIKNVIIRAAYAAAEAAATINIDRLEAAAVQEYRELGKLVRT